MGALVEPLKGFINTLSAPTYSFTLSLVLFWLAMRSRKLWSKAGGIALLIGGTTFFVLSTLDENFRLIVSKPDNVPIVMMVFLVGFFMWLAMNKATTNDELIAEGLPTFEKSEVEDKIFTWPDLVFSEFICMVLLTVGMVVWSILLQAPLEEPANLATAPNPSKAPWYFLGLQEMLVYFDPWMAGVVLPGLIVLGLMAVPYLDTNEKGNGYYTYKERRSEIWMFMFGWIVLWIQLIVIGTFLRGPNWNFFGPYEYWDFNKLEPLVNVQLSEFFWIKWLGMGLPSSILIREAPGILLIGAYFFALPVLLKSAKVEAILGKMLGSVGKIPVIGPVLRAPLTLVEFCRGIFEKMGPPRYYTGITLLLVMMLMPIKMYCRWFFNLKYFVNIQEYFFNI